MGKINKEWHLKNKMPKNPTMDQRLKWHKEHCKHCACRPMPQNLQEEYWKSKKPILSAEEHEKFMKKMGISKEEHDKWHRQFGGKDE